MTKYYALLITIFIGLTPLFVQAHEETSESTTKSQPILFVPNEGQWDGPFKFKGLHKNADIFIEDNGITFRIGDGKNAKKIHDYKYTEKDDTLYYHNYNIRWENANPQSQIIVADKANGTHNYFLGNKPERWKSNLGLYGTLMYKNIYNNIDVKYYTSEDMLKYDFIVRPNGNPKNIKISYNGLEGIKIQDGQLVLNTSVGNVIEMAPYAYQIINGNKVTVNCKYALKNNELSFSLPNGYNKQYDLVIDPVMVFATLSGSTADNWGFSATYDVQGNLYAGGITAGLGYPTTLGAYSVSFSGGNTPWDVTISKFNPTGTALVYSTYLGGSGDEMPHSLVVDQNNNLIVAGKTLSLDFPTTSSAYQSTHNGGVTDIFICKFNSNGSNLLASTYLGGSGEDGINFSLGFNGNQNTLKYNYGDDSRSEVIVDNSGNIYLAASTQSTNFPTTTNAVKRNLTGAQDGIFVKFNPTLSAMIYGTLIGGNNYDAAYVITLDKSEQNIYIAGGTQSNDFHHSTNAGSIITSSPGGTADGYIVKFLNSGNYPMLRSTYIGTDGYDQVYGIQVDYSNNVYIMGQTTGAYPVTPGVYANANSPQFIHKLNNNFTSTIYSTIFGNGNRTYPNLSLVAMLVDTCENVYVSGWGGNITFGSTTNGLPVTPNALQNTTDGADFYFFVLAKNAVNLLYASFFGAVGKSEHVDGGTSRFDPSGIIYQAMCASCGAGTAFPATPGAYSAVKGGPNCNIGLIKLAFNMGVVDAVASAAPNTSGCAPFTVNFSNNSTNATQYFWEFGPPGASSSAFAPSYTYNTPGNYTVRLVAYNPNSCKEYDTTYINIFVRNDSVSPNFTYTPIDTCYSFDVDFSNTTTMTSALNPNLATYVWDFGDGTNFTGRNPPRHTYPNYGTFTATLTVTHPNGCNNPAVISKTIVFNDNLVSAELDPPSLVCINQPFTLNPVYRNGLTYSWDFGDGNTSNLANPSHSYSTPGDYEIRLIVGNPNTCNRFDTVIVNVTAWDIPIALFNYSPMEPQTNTGTQFNNLSEKGDLYFWDFGDGRTSTEKNPYHEFYSSGTFKVCLTVKNEAGCEDVTCKNIISIVHNVADIPTGFSPNGDGTNDVLYVRGYNIETMHLKIFNRFGNLVFETKDQNIGWDGTYNGVKQEMEAYGYTLDVTFRDKQQISRKGNVTLIQ